MWREGGSIWNVGVHKRGRPCISANRASLQPCITFVITTSLCTRLMFPLFNKRQSKQPTQLSLPTPTHDAHPHAFTVSADGHHTTSLPPKLVAPAVPHPSPHSRLVLYAAPEGLLIRPNVAPHLCASYVCVTWGGVPDVKVVTVTSPEGAEWDGPIVYGLVGVITVYQGVLGIPVSCTMV